MKAAVLEHYDKKGSQLVIKDVAIPELKPDEILVQVYYAAVNPLDNMIIRKEVKLLVDYPVPLIMGNEYSGVVVKVGSKVHSFKVNDRIYGRTPLKQPGAFAQYIAVPASSASLIPSYMNFKEAATVPLTALTAMQAFELMGVKAGQTIFISGGTGSVGAMAIPIAHRLGLYVITNGSGKNEDRVLKLGADRFIDYKKEDFSQTVHDVDCVLDTLGMNALPQEFQILKRGGHLVSLRGLPNGRFADRMHLSWWKKFLFSIAGRKLDRLAAKKDQTYDFLFVQENGDQLSLLNTMFSPSDPLNTSIDSIYTLENVNDALDKVKNGHSTGKTLIELIADSIH